MEVRIVGTITDATQLDEIQDIAKIFVYEHRMKTMNITPTPTIKPTPHHKLPIQPIYKPANNTYNILHHIRGLS